MPTIAELIKSLPDEAAQADRLHEPLASASLRPVPVGRLRRIGLLGTLQAKIAAAYLFYWMRGWLCSADDRERLLTETHWRTAVRVLDSMGYLRGAVMKVGQTLANFPDIAPKEFVETLERLQYDAPPMHWALLREMVHNELGDDPENVFASFEKRAFAAASLGQVHRADLRSGKSVAVKIQYPGIARTITEDFKNLLLFLSPGRLLNDWVYIKDQFEDLRLRLETEVNYLKEAATQEKARMLFRDQDGIVVPKAYPELSTDRVLTMDYLEGIHLEDFLRSNPSQDQRNEAGRKITRAWYRLFAAGRLLYADFHPGNILFLPDGRIGLIDFGFVVPLEGELWATMRRMDRCFVTGGRAVLEAAAKEWQYIKDDPAEAERLELSVEFIEWTCRSRWFDGDFNFGDEADFRQGIDLAAMYMRRRYGRSHPTSVAVTRHNFGFRAVLYRLKAKFNLQAIAKEEMRRPDGNIISCEFHHCMPVIDLTVRYRKNPSVWEYLCFLVLALVMVVMVSVGPPSSPVFGAIPLILAFLLDYSDEQRQKRVAVAKGALGSGAGHAQPDAAPNGGSATPTGNLRATERPPSVR